MHQGLLSRFISDGRGRAASRCSATSSGDALQLAVVAQNFRLVRYNMCLMNHNGIQAYAYNGLCVEPILCKDNLHV